MNETRPSPPSTDQSAHAPHQRAVAAHFAGRASPASEAAMRGHLLDCPTCKRQYERHLLLGRLDPRALPAVERLAQGLGLGLGRRRAPTLTAPRDGRGWGIRLAVPILGAAALLLVLGKANHRPAPPSTDGASAFVPRGPGHVSAVEPALWAYGVGAPGAPRLLDRAIVARDELAFAYSNPAGKPYLMVFGADEHRHVYWFHPAWPEGAPAPSSVDAAAGPGPHELQAAIRQPLDGRRLDVYAVFSERPLRSTTIEQHIPDVAGDARAFTSLGEGIVTIRRTFAVSP